MTSNAKQKPNPPPPNASGERPGLDAVTVAILASAGSAPLARLPCANVALPCLVRSLTEAADPNELSRMYAEVHPRVCDAMREGFSLVVHGVTSGYGVNPLGFFWSCMRVGADGNVYPLSAGNSLEFSTTGLGTSARRRESVVAQPPGRALGNPTHRIPVPSPAAAATLQRAGTYAGCDPTAFLTLTYMVKKAHGSAPQTVECRLQPQTAALLLSVSRLSGNSPARLVCSQCRAVAPLSHNCVRCAKPLLCGGCGARCANVTHKACRRSAERNTSGFPAIDTASVCPTCHTARPLELAALPCPTCAAAPL